MCPHASELAERRIMLREDTQQGVDVFSSPTTGIKETPQTILTIDQWRVAEKKRHGVKYLFVVLIAWGYQPNFIIYIYCCESMGRAGTIKTFKI